MSNPKPDPWKGAIAIMLVSQATAAFSGHAITRAFFSGSILEIVIVTWAGALGVMAAVVSGYIAVKLGRASAT